jgi:putative acetyltransferase
MIVRDERAGDADAIHAVVTEAFGQPDEAKLVDLLREDGDCAISLVAEDDGQIVGHVLFSPMTAPFRALSLAPVSVAPAHQRTGIGGALIRAGLDRARRDGWEVVFVLGDPAYYRRFGFEAKAAEGFTSPYAGPYLMAVGFNGALPAKTGTIGHAPAFSVLSEDNEG